MIFGEEYLTPEEVAYNAEADGEVSTVREAIVSGQWSPELSHYNAIRDELMEAYGILTRAGLAILPMALLSKALHLTHRGHPGITK